MRLVYDAGITAIAMVHAFFGVTWFGLVSTADMLVRPILKKSTKLVELAPLGAIMPRVSIAATVASLLTVLTGFIFLAAKFGTDPGAWVSNPEPRMVIVALSVALLSLVIGFTILKPMGEEMMKNRPATPPPPEAEIPPPMKEKLGKMAMFLNIQGILMIVMLVCMVLALNGGI